MECRNSYSLVFAFLFNLNQLILFSFENQFMFLILLVISIPLPTLVMANFQLYYKLTDITSGLVHRRL